MWLRQCEQKPFLHVCECSWTFENVCKLFERLQTMLSLCKYTLIGRFFPHPTFMDARGAHKQYHRYNYSYHRVQNSYQLFRKPWFDTIVLLFLHVTTSNPKGSTFSISSPFVITILQKKNSWCDTDWQLSVPNVNGHTYSYRLPLL